VLRIRLAAILMSMVMPASSVSAETVSFVLAGTSVTPASRTVSGTLLVRRTINPETLDPVTLSVTVPGSVTTELPRGRYVVELTAAGYWIAPRMFSTDESRQVTCRSAGLARSPFCRVIGHPPR
jgi:hypothetical protein